MYPNPASNELFVKTANLDISDARFIIYDIQGRQQFISRESNDTFQMDISLLESGMYILEYRSANKAFQKKFIKQ